MKSKKKKKLADCLSKDVDYVITNQREQSRLSLTPNIINRTQSIMVKANKVIFIYNFIINITI